MFLHFNLDAPSPASVSQSPGEIGSSSFIVFHSGVKSHQRNTSALAVRPLRSVKSRDGHLLSSPVTPNFPKPAASIPRASGVVIPPRAPGCRSPISPTFRPLPPVPSASSLQLPAFFSPSLDEPHTSPSPSSARKHRSPELPSAVDIPAFSHPNSPYVPWSQDVRQEILPPSSPVSFDPHSCSREGARAPEPGRFFERHDVQRKDVQDRTRGWRGVRKSIKKGIRSIVKRVGYMKETLRSRPLPHTAERDPVWDDFSPIRATFPELPATSVDSVVTTSLEDWLDARHQLSLEHASSSEHSMTIEDYDHRGSWIHEDTPPDSDEESDKENEYADIIVPCGNFLHHEITSPTFSVFSDNLTVSSDHRASVLFTLQQLDTLSEYSLPPPSDHTASSLQLSEVHTPASSLSSLSFNYYLSYTQM
ncbi:hypothetical protein HGRIS_007697 [Hohenbuehelia grisea]|uniref:Uncharacterized protein n=1 Tax=Hohenbuehelia grisea TaxID=104357 RepID=A0ABR3J5M1_9AGAR